MIRGAFDATWLGLDLSPGDRTSHQRAKDDAIRVMGCSVEECGRYLETIKTYETKPADLIQERTDNDYLSRMSSALTVVRGVNKTDVLTLGSTFKSLSAVLGASMEELARCPGIGERKVRLEQIPHQTRH